MHENLRMLAQTQQANLHVAALEKSALARQERLYAGV
jgi:hypothetical protein